MAKARRKKDVSGKADETTGGVTSEAIELIRQDPNVMAVLPQASASARQIEAWAEWLPINNQMEYEVVADFLREIKTLQKVWLDKFEGITSPLYQAWQAALALRREITAPADRAEVTLKGKMETYLVAAAQKRREVEAQREWAQLAQQQLQIAAQEAMEQQTAQALAQAQAQPQPWGVTPLSVHMVTPIEYGLPFAATPQPAATYHNPMAAIAAPRQAEGISASTYHTVQISSTAPVVAWLLQNGLADGLLMVDCARMTERVSGDGDEAKMWRMMLGSCPDIRITEHAKITARSYSTNVAQPSTDPDDIPF